MIGSLKSVASYLAGRKATFVLIGLALGMALTLGIESWRDTDPQGETNSNCDKLERSSIPSRMGMTVSSHTTACTTLGTSVVSYVYVHPSDQRPTAENLVFRYTQGGSDDAIRVEWVDERHVLVQVKRVSGVSKIQTTIGPVSIDYRIGGG